MADKPEHVLICNCNETRTQRRQRAIYLALVASLKKVLVVRLPRNNIRKSRTQLGISLVAGYLPSFEAETSVDAKTLIIEVSVCV